MANLKSVDPQIAKLIELEEKRQREVLEMIPSSTVLFLGLKSCYTSYDCLLRTLFPILYSLSAISRLVNLMLMNIS